MTSLKKMRVLARIMLAASVIACLAGTYITVRSVVEMIHIFSRGEAERAVLAPVITELAEGIVLGVHYFFVSKFFLHSIRHGVPFTHEGARELKILGLESIILPVLAWVVSAIAYAWIQPPLMVMEISAYEIVLGFALIIASYMTEYGTDKIERGHMGHQEIRYLEEHHPEILKEARTAVFGSEEAAEEYYSSMEER